MNPLRPIRTAFAVLPCSLLVALVLALALFIPAAALAAPAMVSGEVLIRFRPGASDADIRAIQVDLGATRVKRFRSLQVEEQRITRRTIADAVSRYRNHPAVEFIEPNYIVHADLVPNDPLFSQQWGLRNTGQSGGTSGADVAAVPAWDVSTGSSTVVIAIIDTGVDATHPDLAGNIWTNPTEIPGNGVDDDGNGLIDDVHGYDFLNLDADPTDDNGHGTHVAGIAAARGNDGVGIAGVAWNVKILPLKFLGPDGTGPISAAIDCIEYAVAKGAKILNNSWGGYDFSAALELAIQHANDAGALFVAAAGNDGESLDQFDHYPATFREPNVIAVAATDERDQMASFSNYGLLTVPIAAPGTHILSTFAGGGYQELNGTSMSAPLVSGALALLESAFPSLTASQAKSVLIHSADPVPGLAGLTSGGGRLNVARMLGGPDSIAPSAVADLTVVGADANRLSLRWSAPGDDGASGTAARYDIRYDVAPIDESSFDRAAVASPAPRPSAAGGPEEFVLTGLQFKTTYYVALKTLDEFGNESGLSNVASGTTGGAPDVDVAPASLSQTLLTGLAADQSITLRNTGEGSLHFSIDAAPEQPAASPPQEAPGQPASLSPRTSPAVAAARARALLPPSIRLAKGADDTRPGVAAAAGRGGPDLFGHTWLDSDQPGGPIFAWTDIRAIGTPIVLSGDDELSRFVPIGFTFPFYGGIFDFVRVCTNGFFSFTSGQTDYLNQPLPSDIGAPNLVAPFWDDLLFDLHSTAYAYGDSRRFVVQWDNVSRVGGGGPYAFQAILEPDGTITFQYRAMGPPVSSATVGIQNAGQSDGLTVAFNHVYVHDNLAVRITAAPRWLSASPISGTLAPGQSQPVTVHFNATGLAEGGYDGAVRISSDDPDEPVVAVTAHLAVGAASDISLEGGTLTFLNVPVGSSDTQSLFVSNRGSAALEISGITASPAVFETAPGPFTVAPGQEMEVAVTFRPTAPGTVVGTLTFQSNDPDEAVATVVLSGTGTAAPQFTVAPTRVAAALLPGGAKLKGIVIRNSGAADLHWAVTLATSGTDSTWVRIAPREGTLPPGRSSILAVFFNARGLSPGDITARATFRSDGPARPSVPVDLVLHVGTVGVAAFNLEPRLLVDSKGRGLVTAEVELLPGFDPSHVVLSTVKLAGRVSPLDRALRITDFNRNGIPDLKFHFDRREVLRALPEGDKVEVTISGEIRDSTYFQGVETIRVQRSGHHRDNDGPADDSDEGPPRWETVAGVDGLETEWSGAPERFALYPSAPNPVRAETVFRFDLPAAGAATLRIFAVNGRLVREWRLGPLPAGRHRLHWDARGEAGQRLAAGIYFSRLDVAGAEPFEASRRVLLIR
ncbi:MAG: S8 family serine peptidase [Candidatus Eiseniibacteriota bacterium]